MDLDARPVVPHKKKKRLTNLTARMKNRDPNKQWYMYVERVRRKGKANKQNGKGKEREEQREEKEGERRVNEAHDPSNRWNLQHNGLFM